MLHTVAEVRELKVSDPVHQGLASHHLVPALDHMVVGYPTRPPLDGTRISLRNVRLPRGKIRRGGGQARRMTRSPWAWRWLGDVVRSEPT